MEDQRRKQDESSLSEESLKDELIEVAEEYTTFTDVAYASDPDPDDDLPDLLCQTCFCKFPTRESYETHLITHTPISSTMDISSSRKNTCKFCSRSFKRRSELLGHLSECELRGPPLRNCGVVMIEFNCAVCHENFESHEELVEHQIVHSSKKAKRVRRKKTEIVADHFCDVCSRGFTRRHDMLKHRAKQHKNAPDLLKSDSSRLAQNKNLELLRRCKVLTADGRECFKCEICSKLIHLPYNFVRHQSIHTGARPFFCHICGKSYRLSSTLNRHIKELHYRIKKYSCEICGRKFAAKASLDDHKNIHTNERPFVCDMCGKSFKQKSSLHIHKLFHSNVFRFSCPVCGKKYRRARDLKVHSWLHTGHRPYSCEICGSMFRLSQDLKRHTKVHSKTAADCVCGECGASFTQQRYLRNHKKTHEEKVVTEDA